MGAIVPKDDVDALAKAMWMLSVDPDRRTSWVRPGRPKSRTSRGTSPRRPKERSIAK